MTKNMVKLAIIAGLFVVSVLFAGFILDAASFLPWYYTLFIIAPLLVVFYLLVAVARQQVREG